nr:hypothetical protein [uncultured Nitrososphaera sp.]
MIISDRFHKDNYTYYYQDGKSVTIIDNQTDSEATYPLQLLNHIVKQAKALQKVRTV